MTELTKDWGVFTIILLTSQGAEPGLRRKRERGVKPTLTGTSATFMHHSPGDPECNLAGMAQTFFLAAVRDPTAHLVLFVETLARGIRKVVI